VSSWILIATASARGVVVCQGHSHEDFIGLLAMFL